MSQQIRAGKKGKSSSYDNKRKLESVNNTTTENDNNIHPEKSYVSKTTTNCSTLLDSNDVVGFHRWQTFEWLPFTKFIGKEVHELITKGTIDSHLIQEVNEIEVKVNIINSDFYDKFASHREKNRIEEILKSFKWAYYILLNSTAIIPDSIPVPTSPEIQEFRECFNGLAWDQIAFNIASAEIKVTMTNNYDKGWLIFPKIDQEIIDRHAGGHGLYPVIKGYQITKIVEDIASNLYKYSALDLATEKATAIVLNMSVEDYGKHNLNPNQLLRYNSILDKAKSSRTTANDSLNLILKGCLTAYNKIAGTAKDIISLNLANADIVQANHGSLRLLYAHFNGKKINMVEDERRKLFAFKIEPGNHYATHKNILRDAVIGWSTIKKLETLKNSGAVLSDITINQQEMESNWGACEEGLHFTTFGAARLVTKIECAQILRSSLKKSARFKVAATNLDGETNATLLTFEQVDIKFDQIESTTEAIEILASEIRLLQPINKRQKIDEKILVERFTDKKGGGDKTTFEGKPCYYCKKQGYFETPYKVKLHTTNKCFYNPENPGGTYKQGLIPRDKSSDTKKPQWNNDSKGSYTKPRINNISEVTKLNKKIVDLEKANVLLTKASNKKKNKSNSSRSSGEEDESDISESEEE